MDGGGTIVRKVTKKDKLNGFKALDALSMLETIVLNVVHFMHI